MDFPLTHLHHRKSTRYAGGYCVWALALIETARPSPVLRDRITTAAELYFDGKVQKLLMSGDNRFLDYNEPGAMQAYALELGVPESDIILDYAGRRTYDTCYRARFIFDVTDALVVTQAYHLPRVLVTCQGLGINAIGVVADQRDYNPRPCSAGAFAKSRLLW